MCAVSLINEISGEPKMPAKHHLFTVTRGLLRIALLVCLFLIAILGLVLVAWMFLLASRIVDTASDGDPFVTQNADRLNYIGFLLLAIQLIGFAVDSALGMFPNKIRDHVSIGFDVSATGILAALLIFVLAQIFRRGSEMREELEAMV